MDKVILMSLDLLENATQDNFETSITDVIAELLNDKENENIIITYSRDRTRLANVKRKFPIKNHNNLIYTTRTNVKDLLKKHEKSLFLVVGKKNVDFQMAVNNKLLLITPIWFDLVEKNAMEYGIKVENPLQLYNFIQTINNQNTWYSKLTLPDKTTILSLTDARTFEKYTKSKEEREVLEKFNQILKKGSRNYYEMFLYHFISSISNNSALFEDINYWGFFPSSSGDHESNEMYYFKETVRKMMKGQPLRNEYYIRNPNLLIRHTPTYKSHDIRDVNKRINIGSDNHFSTIHLNPGYKNKLENKNVCIFDDYLTHGNSFECARNLLRKANVGKIIFVTLGRFVRPYQYQEYEINGDIYTNNYDYNRINRFEIHLSEFEINENAKTEVENLHRIFNL